MSVPLFNRPPPAQPRPLWPHQVNAIAMTRASLLEGRHSPLLQIPTGGGKTEIATAFARDYRDNGCRVIFVVPRLSLIEQTVTAFARSGLDHIGVIQGQNFRTDPTAPIQIASAQTLARRDIPPTDLVIVDEAHLQFRKINEWVTSPEWSHVPFIGLTATPWARGMGLVWDDLLKPTSISELIETGVLTPARVFSHQGPDLTGVKITGGDYNEAGLSDACDKKEIIADVIRTWIEKGEDRPTLCYGVDRKHAQHLQERFLEAGVAAEYIDCDTAIYDREEIFARFTAGATRVICNVATLDTGIDLDVRCIIDARPTKSRIRFVQTVGRGLRRALGKDFLIVLDHAGHHIRLGLVQDIDANKLHKGVNDVSLDTGKPEHEPRIKLCPACTCILPPGARECPACGVKIFAATEVSERDGELVEIGKAATAPRYQADHDYWHGALLMIAMRKGYAKGWATHQFKEKFGFWPEARHQPEREPTLEILNWVRSRQIAFAKARARA
jgi:DNA repair protein RadD